MSLGLCVGVCDCMTVDVVDSCMHYSTKYHTQQPLYNTLELLMMGIVMPETC